MKKQPKNGTLGKHDWSKQKILPVKTGKVPVLDWKKTSSIKTGKSTDNK